MPIEPITEHCWPEILQLQAEAYYNVEPESLAVLQHKWLRSPDSCFVFRHGPHLLGYLLAHRWHQQTPPKLFHPLQRLAKALPAN